MSRTSEPWQDIDVRRLVRQDCGEAEQSRRQRRRHEHLRQSLIRCYGKVRAPPALVDQVKQMFDLERRSIAVEARAGLPERDGAAFVRADHQVR